MQGYKAIALGEVNIYIRLRSLVGLLLAGWKLNEQDGFFASCQALSVGEEQLAARVEEEGMFQQTAAAPPDPALQTGGRRREGGAGGEWLATFPGGGWAPHHAV